MADLGAREAINLDGGGSAALVAGGRLRNRPRAIGGQPILHGRPILTALVFSAQDDPRSARWGDLVVERDDALRDA